MRVVVQRMDHCPLVAAAIVVPSGWRHEPPGLEGLAHLVEHSCLLGPASCPNVDAATLPFGAHLDGETRAELTVYRFVCLAEDADPMLSLLRDVVFHPAFDPDRLAAER